MMMTFTCVPSLPWPFLNPVLPRPSFDHPSHTSSGANEAFVADSNDVAHPRPANDPWIAAPTGGS